ncbi:MAG: ABC transporter ATP-binding protein [Deltaproteobacteria bacterium]|nr:ABC transporter ATP-binding protein [Deltaproteobacteria bacterium]
MLEIENLSVAIGDKPILHDVCLSVPKGETHVLFGPNGSGKTTLLMAIMGFPRYRVITGKIWFLGQDITDLPMDERARLGVGMSFQRPPAVRGVKTRDILRSLDPNAGVQNEILEVARQLSLEELIDREINHGFSGGEIKRSELLQLFAQAPRLVLLDEPESGVDLVNMALVGQMTNRLLQKDLRRTRSRSGLIITHTGHILDYVNAIRGYVMIEGKLWSEGNPLDMLDCIKRSGYKECMSCQR